MASDVSGTESGLAAPVVHEPDLAAVAPAFDVTVGPSDRGLDGDDAVYELGVTDTSGGADDLHVVQTSARRVCVGPLAPGHEYLLRWRAVAAGEPGPVPTGEGASCGPWSRCVQVRVAGLDGPMVDLRDLDADDVGRTLGRAGSRSAHSGRWLWMRGPVVASAAGLRALRGEVSCMSGLVAAKRDCARVGRGFC